jgi:hypothetical protein
LGVDGSSFKIHAMLDGAKGWRVGDGLNNGQAYQYRKRHNNGRSFTVTQAYENKIADMTHWSRLPAFSGVSSGGSADITNLGSTYGTVAAAVSVKADVGVANFNPGTYYNVKLHTTSTQTNAFAKVVVNSGGISQVEIVSGGIKVDPLVTATVTYQIRCDTRINSDLTCTQATGAVSSTNAYIEVVAGDSSSEAKWNVLTVSMPIGTAAGSPTGTSTNFCSTANGVRRNVLGTCVAKTGATASLFKAQLDCTCDGAKDVATCSFVGGGSGDRVSSASIAIMLEATVCTLSGNIGGGTYTIEAAAKAVNTMYHIAGFYDTGTPKYFVDALHEGLKDGELVQASGAFTVMGGISGTSNYLYRGKVGVNEPQMYHDLNSPGFQGAGNGRGVSSLRETASVVLGEGPGLTFTQTVASWYVEHAQKYQYAGRGFDQLTVSPAPDRMADQKIVVTYRGAAGACSVKEVDRGTHESSVCSGRGNCDGATGTCVCDAGYTLEACSEQTVLV